LSGAAPTFEGTSDLALAGRKISGNAQHRKRTHLLHHGSLLYQFDAAPLARYLQAPPRQPEYRRGRSHADFVTNVPLTATALRQLIKEAWSADEPFLDWPMDLASKLAAEKYASAEWIRRR
jgi:lipoate-protein ligase A